MIGVVVKVVLVVEQVGFPKRYSQAFVIGLTRQISHTSGWSRRRIWSTSRSYLATRGQRSEEGEADHA